jgi:Tol biopolymer transport system component
MATALRATKLRHGSIARRELAMGSLFTDRHLLAWLLAASLLAGCNAVAPSMPPTADTNPLSGVLVGTEPYIWADNPAAHIFTMNADGTDKTTLTDDDGNRTPMWTCDGRQIYYVSKTDIWVMNADGSDKRQVTSGISASTPSVACDGTLLFGSFSSTTAKATIWINDRLTGAPRLISDESNFDAAARISPDATKVVFTRYLDFDPQTGTDSARELFVMNSDGSDVRQLTFVTDDANAPNANAPAWSPDSTQIAFFNGFEETGPGRTTPDVRNLAVINADGTGKHYLTHCDVTTSSITDSKSPGSCADDPNWAPDGNWILYSSAGVDVGMNTYFIATDGSGMPRELLPGLILFGNGGGRPLKSGNSQQPPTDRAPI